MIAAGRGRLVGDVYAVDETTYLFDEPGTVVYACHLPVHVAYGMVGEIEVRKRRISGWRSSQMS